MTRSPGKTSTSSVGNASKDEKVAFFSCSIVATLSDVWNRVLKAVFGDMVLVTKPTISVPSDNEQEDEAVYMSATDKVGIVLSLMIYGGLGLAVAGAYNLPRKHVDLAADFAATFMDPLVLASLFLGAALPFITLGFVQSLVAVCSSYGTTTASRSRLAFQSALLVIGVGLVILLGTGFNMNTIESIIAQMYGVSYQPIVDVDASYATLYIKSVIAGVVTALTLTVITWLVAINFIAPPTEAEKQAIALKYRVSISKSPRSPLHPDDKIMMTPTNIGGGGQAARLLSAQGAEASGFMNLKNLTGLRRRAPRTSVSGEVAAGGK